MANVTNASTEDIYERLVDTNGYHPFEANTFAPWTLEAGDTVKMKRGTEEYDSPVHTTRMVWKGTPTMQVNSTGNKERESVSKVGKKKYGRGGAGMRTQQGLYYDLYSEDGTLHSSLIMTASILRTEFDAANSTVYSVIEQTATYIKSEVASVQSDMRSLILQTPEMIHSEVGSAVSGFAQSVIEQTATYIHMEVSGAASSISATVIQQTSEYVRTEVRSVASGVAWSVVEQTMTGIITEVGRKSRVFVQMADPVTTGEDVHEKDIWIQSTSVRSWSMLGQESWSTRSVNEWRQYYGAKMFVRNNGAWEEVTDSSVPVEQQVTIDHTEDHFAVLGKKVDSQGEEYRSRLQVTAQEIRGEVSTASSKLYSVVIQTATNVFSGVYDEVADNFSTIEQTASSITLSVNSAKSSLYSVIQQTSTYIMTTVGNTVSGLRSTITQTASKIALVVDSSNNIKAAQIVASINDSSSSVLISADKITLDGHTIAYYITADYIKTKLLEATGVTLNGVTVNSSAAFNGSLLFKNGTDQYGNTYFNALNALQAVQITGPTNNSYKLQYKRVRDSDWQDAQSFSRAVTDWRYSWSGGQLTVTALPQNNSKAITGVKTTGSWSNNVYSGRVVYWDGTDDDGSTYDTGATFSVSRKITGWNYQWVGGQLIVTAQPQGTSEALTGVKVAGSWSNGTYSGRIVYWDGTDDDGSTWNTGQTFTLSDGNLISSNVRDGVTIFGVTGSYSGGGGGSITRDDIQIDSSSYTRSDTDPRSDATDANAMKSYIVAAMNNHQWFAFRIYVRGTSADKWYKFKFA